MPGPGLFRLILATLVVISHTTTARFGVVAVIAFFILSGFWVTRMYRDRYGRAPRPVATFYLSRALRLWPAYAVATLIAIALKLAGGQPVGPRFLSALSMLGVATRGHDPLGISWSLDIEAQFYLILPLLLGLAARMSPGAAAVAVALGTLAGLGLSFGLGVETALFFLPAFAAGLAIAVTGWRVSGRGAILSLAAFLALGVALWLIPQTSAMVVEGPMPRRWVRLGSLIWGLSLVPFVAWNVRQASGALDRRAGDFSYALYLIHYPVIAALVRVTGADSAADITLPAIAASFATAILFFAAVERPFERLRQRIMDRRMPPVTAAP